MSLSDEQATATGRLAGKIALITGASRGLGAAVAERFAREGAHLVLTGRPVGGLEETDDRGRASRGLSRAAAGRFAGEGAHLVLTGRTVGGLEETDDRVRAAGGSATLVPFDLRDFIKLDELAAALYERYGRLDILIGNAGEFGVFSPLGHIDPVLWGEVIGLNLTPHWRRIRAKG